MGRMGLMGRMNETMGCMFWTFHFHRPIVLFIRPIRPMQFPAPSTYASLKRSKYFKLYKQLACISVENVINFLFDIVPVRMSMNTLSALSQIVFKGKI